MTLLAPRPQRPVTAAAPSPPRLRYVPGLDGLRAVAVLAVIAYHLQWPFIQGGFLGVDLFFVLSGFLITSLLLRTPSDPGLRPHLAEFYLRRTRRLLPAMTLLLLAVGAWAAFIALPEQISQLRQQGLGTIFYVSNWVFMAEDISYLDAFSDPSPLQHTWSLAIEEQFYLVWPVIVLVLLGRRLGRAWLLAGAIGVAIASAALMWAVADSGALNDAYLGTFSRVHELMIGAVAAMLIPVTARGRHRYTSPRVVNTTITASAIVIGVSMLVLTPLGLTYYQGGSVLFSIVVATLIVVIVRHRPKGGAILGNPVMRWIGAISYGLYLWHWPIIVWLTPATTPLDGLALDGLRVVAMFAAAAASYYLIEQPIRRGGWRNLAITVKGWWIAVPVSMALTAFVFVAATASAAALPQSEAPPAKVAPADHLIGSESPGARTLMVVGDSVPQEVMIALGAAAAPRNVAIVPLAFGGCSVVGEFQVESDGKRFTWSKRCTDVTDLQSQAIAEHAPDTVVWYSNRERYSIRTGDGTTLVAGTPEHRATMEAAIEATARRLTVSGAELVIVQPVPKAEAIMGECSREPTSGDCAASPTQMESFTWLRSVYTDIADALPRTHLVNVDDLLCPSGMPCPALEHDGIVVRPDGVHIAEQLEPWFAEQLLGRILAYAA
jgi:peptidoglycan/LPS O-acetylase OafA/YrhL